MFLFIIEKYSLVMNVTVHKKHVAIFKENIKIVF